MTRILVAEPDRRIREFMSGIFADCGHAVEACANGDDAIASLGTGSVDVVVTDLMLTRGQEADFGQNCAALGIPLITLSGREYQPNRREAERPPRLLEKPFRFADLRCVLDAVAHHRATPPPGPLPGSRTDAGRSLARADGGA